MPVLAEAESISSYSRKRLALSFEQPTAPKRSKSHSPNEANMTWNVEGAMAELQNVPPNQKINWSSVARKYSIPQRNAGQVLKETATKHGIDTSRLEQGSETVHTPRIRRYKSPLSGGEISMPCLPTVRTIREEKKQLILSGELNIGEPCAPFHLTKSIITSEGNVQFKDVCMWEKISLTDIQTSSSTKENGGGYAPVY